LAFVTQVVPVGTIWLLSSTVPPAEALVLKINPELAEVASPAYLTPILTKFIVSPLPIATGVSSIFTSSIWSNVLEFINVVASSGVTSSMSVFAPVQSPLSPIALDLK